MAAVGVKPISSSEKQTNNFRDNGRCYFKNLDLLKYGITRLADHTGLDEIGIPVWAVIRPDARSVSQCHGKGLTHDQAQISAVMEGIETALAETAEHRVEMIASANEMLRARRPIADFALMLKCVDGDPDQARKWRWIKGKGVASGIERFAPLGLVSLDLRHDQQTDLAFFHQNSVGLAAHFKREDAILHGLLEAVEYDALALAMAWPGILEACPQLDGVFGVSEALDLAIAKCRAVQLDPTFQVLTTDIGLPVILCRLREMTAGLAPRRSKPFAGHACRLSMVDAAIAALLEAVQSRMTDISGAREDINVGDYAVTDAPPSTLRKVNSTPLVHSADRLTPPESIALVLKQLASSGLSEPLVFDLHNEGDPVFCVAVHCPGLEIGTAQDGYRSGRRAELRIIKHGLGIL